ncbi:SDR family NAD(P)-dependent oxidoreductase [Legionella quateirensis]|uniref:Short chain dehydrogenase n=1 Tax=Legionella quateirensis TaxID=45072 RepID=A0A378KTR6_9GAMM|nr:SDR family oxidoreductase [Legionella quateirensis]KTD50780.1 short chain dehydrogenase [Legionella quateirensis]STY17975.1 short chain dehydrogenase [Legionella quateirensis]
MMTLVTGASKGIGLCLAREFAQHGRDLMLVARDEVRLKEICNEIHEQYHVKVAYTVCDLSKPGSAINLYNELETRGVEINCLVNNAGIGYMGSYAEMGIDKLDELLQINIVSPSELTQCYLGDFVARNGGSILQVSSTAAFQPGPYMAAYYASKSYLASLSHAIAYELKDTNVSLSILCPGATRTSFFTSAGMENSMLERGYTGMLSPEKVAKIAYKGLMQKKLYIIPGVINKSLANLAAISPKKIAAALAAYFHNKPDNPSH